MSPDLANFIWHTRAALTPGLMILLAYLSYDLFRGFSGLLWAAMSVMGYYLPYVVLTPVRRKGEFFPLGDEGPGLPVVMLIGSALVGGISGIVLGLFGGERIGTWGGGAIGVIAFHSIYFGTVSEKSRTFK